MKGEPRMGMPHFEGVRVISGDMFSVPRRLHMLKQAGEIQSPAFIVQPMVNHPFNLFRDKAIIIDGEDALDFAARCNGGSLKTPEEKLASHYGGWNGALRILTVAPFMLDSLAWLGRSIYLRVNAETYVHEREKKAPGTVIREYC
jgi:hypothetical protein